MVWFLLVLIILVLVFSVYINSRLFRYIVGLEEKIQDQIKRNDNMYQSLKELVQDDFLLSDGRLKKMMYQKEKNRIFNGINIEEQNLEI